MSFKENINAATSFIESCWDENNENDGLTFDERIQKRLPSLEDDVQAIVKNAIAWCDENNI